MSNLVITTTAKESAARRIALEIITAENGGTITFKKGQYRFYGGDSFRAKYYCAGLDSEVGDELSGITYLNKNIGICLKDKCDIVVDGGGAQIIIHGEMTPIVIDGCKNITIKNLAIDYARATVSEMTIKEVTPSYIVVTPNRDSTFAINDVRLAWMGDTFSDEAEQLMVYDKDGGKFFKPTGDFLSFEASAEGDADVKLLFPFTLAAQCRLAAKHGKKPPHGLKAGQILIAKNGLKTQCGAFITESRNIRFENCAFNFSTGAGVLCQCCKNVGFEDCAFAPQEKSGRLIASFGTLLSFVSMRGKCEVKNCVFDGSLEDGVLTADVPFELDERLDDETFYFLCTDPQSVGVNPFKSGDLVGFFDKKGKEVSRGVIMESKMLDARTLEAHLFDPLSKRAKIGCKVKNLSLDTKFIESGNSFGHIAGEEVAKK